LTGADLHCHSIHSDGVHTPDELISMAKEKGLIGLSITDHDTFSTHQSFFDRDFLLIPGIEISAECVGQSVHVLGYAYDLYSKTLDEFCRFHQARRVKRNQAIIENLVEMGMPISWEEVKELSPEASSYGRPHIARVLVKKGYVPDVATAFKRFIGEGKPAYISGDRWRVEEAIHAVHEAGGKAVLAHPHLIKQRSIVRKLLSLPFDGLEAYYSLMPKSENERWRQEAEEHGFFATGGSDFHGTLKPAVHLGSSFTSFETVQMLYRHFLQHVKRAV